MSKGDGQGIGGIRRRSFVESEKSPDHERDLMFIGCAFSNNRLFYFLGRVFEDLESESGRCDERGGAGCPHRDRGTMGLHVNDSLDGHFIGLPLFDEVSDPAADRLESTGLFDAGRD